MTQKEYEDRIAKIMEQEKELGVKIELHPLDKDHLDCTWYGGDVGSITFPDGWQIIIGAHGEIRIYGKIDGEEIDFVDKCNGGSAYHDLPISNDKKLRGYEDEGKITFENNNWFEFDVVAPDGEWCDCGFIFDNVMDNNLLECFEGLNKWINYVVNEWKKWKEEEENDEQE